MGCGISKRSRSRSRRENPFSPLRRSYSLPTHHVVSLTSTTFGSLKLDSLDHPNITNQESADRDDETPTPPRSEAKSWSNFNDKKIRTPLLRSPPNEPAETINAWELMDGLEEDTSPLRSFSMNSWLPKLESPKPVRAEAEGIADFDPEILSQFRKALDELSPPNTCRLMMRSPPAEPERSVRDRIRAFQERIDDVKKENMSPRREDRVVIYFTSLRGVRRTYEDCCNVRTIFRGYGVRADERDVSMHHGFRQELHHLLGTETFGGLPRVFAKGRYVGGAEDVRLMHESGELEKLIQGCEKFKQGVVGVACQGCGDVRFVPCDRCFGSCKVFDEDEEVFLRCPDCNENGIVCCPLCFI